MKRARGQDGVALVEFALAAPIFLFVLLTGLQFALIVMQDYSVRQVARQTARWVAIHPDNTDASVTAYAKSIAMPAMRTDAYANVKVTPSCTALVAGRCSGRDAGSMVSVEVTYSLDEALFLPLEFGFGEAKVGFPTKLPPRKVSVMVE